MSADHIVILILLLALAVKFVFFEVKDELSTTSKCRRLRSVSGSVTEGGVISVCCGAGGMDGWVEVSSPVEHKHVQTDQVCWEEPPSSPQEPDNEPCTSDRPVEECLTICKSEVSCVSTLKLMCFTQVI